MAKSKKKYVALALLIVYILIMMFGFLITVPKDLDAVNDNDKLIHFAEFFVLVIISLKVFQMFNVKHYYVFGIVFCLIFVVLSEYLQSMIPSRSFSYYDMLADTFGIIVGIGVFKWTFSKLSF
ncbi:TPA: hypothetical protein HA235_05280 [Candidatus Woesearchaeota archaeon]|nr:VanZ family protein [Candidatus Woesearchaeota archaeon]HIH32092.1 hypothetical protein [Candidatus Woesearchaeota archaeon]HIH54918.1 hypothetical protein [Candidatus Woesearchaeota archaeon]HIJ01791.1 hypothetical protein [Candidatus Woesearchaeota archaeon]HIJ14036.1 hypothetical protein [Candidatus Woesearchaeota archaeon]